MEYLYSMSTIGPDLTRNDSMFIIIMISVADESDDYTADVTESARFLFF